jgi:hypothetical protein
MAKLSNLIAFIFLSRFAFLALYATRMRPFARPIIARKAAEMRR